MVGELVVAVGAVEPFFAAGSTNGSLDVDDVFAHGFWLFLKLYLNKFKFHLKERKCSLSLIL